MSPDVLHRQEDGAVVVALVEDPDHVGVGQLRRGARLPHEAGGEVVVVPEPAVHDLERADPVQAQVGGLVDGRHAAARDPGADAVPTIEHTPDHRVRPAPVHYKSPPTLPAGRLPPAQRPILRRAAVVGHHPAARGVAGVTVPYGWSGPGHCGYSPRSKRALSAITLAT